MIELDLTNIFKNKIGSEGLDPHVFNEMLKVHQGLLKKTYSFFDLPSDKALVKKINAFSKVQKKNNWENIVVLGIGGSALGLIALYEGLLGNLHNLTQKPRLFVVDNVDPVSTAELLEVLDFKKTLFIVISKSGTTVEPMALYAIVRQKLEKITPKQVSKHLVFITDPKVGLLREIAHKECIATFDVPEEVGGRYSVLSAVGLLPAALMGINIEKLLRGAKSTQALPALKLAIAQYLLDHNKGKCMTVMMPYANALFRFGDWYRQLLAESIGKNLKSGPTPINALGTTDQHSQLQLYTEGPNNKFFIFMQIEKTKQDVKIPGVLPRMMKFLNHQSLGNVMKAALAGTTESLARNGRPNLTINLKTLNEESLGALIMLFQHQVALLGELYKVNAFNQPGVEESKLITKKILASKKGFTITELIIVMGIIATLTAITLPNYAKQKNQFQFTQSMTDMMALIQTARNYAQTSRAAYNPATGTSTVPSEGYGVLIDMKSSKPFTLFANTGSNPDEFDSEDLIESDYKLPTVTRLKKLNTFDEAEAIILFRPPLATASLALKDTHVPSLPYQKTQELKIELSNNTRTDLTSAFITLNAISGFPEYTAPQVLSPTP